MLDAQNGRAKRDWDDEEFKVSLSARFSDVMYLSDPVCLYSCLNLIGRLSQCQSCRRLEDRQSKPRPFPVGPQHVAHPMQVNGIPPAVYQPPPPRPTQGSAINAYSQGPYGQSATHNGLQSTYPPAYVAPLPNWQYSSNHLAPTPVHPSQNGGFSSMFANPRPPSQQLYPPIQPPPFPQQHQHSLPSSYNQRQQPPNALPQSYSPQPSHLAQQQQLAPPESAYLAVHPSPNAYASSPNDAYTMPSPASYQPALQQPTAIVPPPFPSVPGLYGQAYQPQSTGSDLAALAAAAGLNQPSAQGEDTLPSS